jgi:hypothetical protein
MDMEGQKKGISSPTARKIIKPGRMCPFTGIPNHITFLFLGVFFPQNPGPEAKS